MSCLICNNFEQVSVSWEKYHWLRRNSVKMIAKFSRETLMIDFEFTQHTRKATRQLWVPLSLGRLHPDVLLKIGILNFFEFMMMIICFCGMADRQKAFSLISSRDHCQRSSPLQISDMQQAGNNLRWSLFLNKFVELWPATLLKVNIFM